MVSNLYEKYESRVKEFIMDVKLKLNCFILKLTYKIIRW